MGIASLEQELNPSDWLSEEFVERFSSPRRVSYHPPIGLPNLNDNNSQLEQWFHKNDRVFKQNIKKLFVRKFRKQWYCGDTLSILCENFEANCTNILGTYCKRGRNLIICSNSRRCDLCCTQVNMTAVEMTDWFIRSLTLVTL